MIYQYIVGGILASVLSLVLVYKKIQKQTGFNSKKIHMEKYSVSSDLDSEISESAEIIIVGAGVAGSALAYTLGKNGRQVKVIERDLTDPDIVAGELLQTGGYLKLMELGLEDCLNEIEAQKMFGYAMFKNGKSIKLSYQHLESDIAGKSFDNGRFIQRMREKASTLPNLKLEQGSVTSLITEKGTVKGVQYKTKNGQEMIAKAPQTIVCNGCFSNLRHPLCNPPVGVSSCPVALVLENCKLPYANHGHVILGDPSPILFYPISSTEVRCLVDVPAKKVPFISKGEMSHFLKSVVAPQIPPELHNAFISAINSGNIKTMPNRSLPAAPYPTSGALLMGYASNMKHLLTRGMTITLSDIVLLTDLLRPLQNLNDASALSKHLESFNTLQKPTTSTRNSLAAAIYNAFSRSSVPANREMHRAFFDYRGLGGVFYNGPLALFSGISSPLKLILQPWFKNLLLGSKIISGASNIIFHMFNAERVRRVFVPATLSAYNRVRPVHL